MSRSCSRCGSVVTEEARFCESCGAPLGESSEGERKIATMVFADLVGSTELSRTLDPEQLRSRLRPFFEVAGSVLTDHGGTVEKYIGDAVMAVFGAPVSHGDDPDRAVAAALDLVERVGALDGELAVRVGVETGEVLAMGGTEDLAVTGEAVNAAARLQQAAAPGEVLVGDRAARACVRSRFELGPEVDAKGFEQALPTQKALSGGDGGRRSALPLVGREDDLDLLRIVARRALRERIPELVTVVGEAGIGKTRLSAELLEGLRSAPERWRTLIGRNPPYGRGIAFWALGEILHDAAGVPLDAGADEVEGSLRDRLAELGAPDAAEVAGTLVVAIRGAEGPMAGSVEDELKRAWRRFVALLAGDRPLAIAVDDVHWADDGLLDLLEEVAFGLKDAPVLILCTSRPELAERRPDFGRSARNITQVELLPLPPKPARELAELLLPEGSPELATRIAEASGGNPFFAEEVSRAVGDDGDAASPEQLPDTVQAAIAARMDQLPADEKSGLQYASVLGTGFSESSLAELLAEPAGEVLEGLRRKALVEVTTAGDSGHYAFRHQLIREVAYNSLPRADRSRLHERAAAALRERAGERFPELSELASYHLTQAVELEPTEERSDRAQAAVLEAAEVAVRRGAGARGQELYEQAAELARGDGGRVDPLCQGAEVALRRWRGDHAVRLFREAAAAAERAGEGGKAAAAYSRAVEVGARMGGITGRVPREELTAMLDRGVELVSDDDLVTRARLLLDRAWIAWTCQTSEDGIEPADDDRYADMEGPAMEGLELARATGDVALLQSALDAATASDWRLGHQRAAVGRTRERLKLLDEAPDSHALDVERSDALHMMIECLLQTGDFREAADYGQRARDLDLSRGIIYSAWQRGLLPAFFLGRWDQVLEMANRVREAWIAAERPPLGFFASSIGCAGAIHGYRGDSDAAEDWLAVGESLANQGSAQLSGVRMMRAEVELHHGRDEAAAEHLDSTELGGNWWGAPYFATRAEAYVRSGRPDAGTAITEAEANVGEHRYAQGILLRARGIRDEDPGLLGQSHALFREIECPYQMARSGWLLGDDERAEADRILAELKAVPLGR